MLYSQLYIHMHMGRAAWKTLPPLSTCLAFAIRHTEPHDRKKKKTDKLKIYMKQEELKGRGGEAGGSGYLCVPSSNCRACQEFNMR